MKDNDERIEELRYQIDKLSPMIEKELSNINDNSTFAEKFAAKVNKITLSNRQRELEKLLSAQQENELELHITGEDIGYGTAPADIIADMITKFQNLLRAISTSGKVTDSIKHATQLRLVAFETSSFKIRLAGPTTEDTLFKDDKTINNDRLFYKSVKNLFSLLSSPDSTQTLDKVKSKGVKFMRAYYDYAHAANNHNINIDTTWYTQKGAVTKRISSAQFKYISKILSETNIVTKTETHLGKFIAIDTAKKTFTFQSALDHIIVKGKYNDYETEKLREYKISPFDNQYYVITVTNCTDLLKKKSTYSLLDLIPKQKE